MNLPWSQMDNVQGYVYIKCADGIYCAYEYYLPLLTRVKWLNEDG